MTVARWQGTVVDSTGATVASASVAVYSETTGALATIYSDRAGTVSISNPATADSEGFIGFYAAGDAYRIVASSGATSREFRYVGIGTSQEEDKPLTTIIDTTVFSGAPSVTVSDISIYRKVVIEFERLQVTTDTADLNCVISTDDGVSFISSSSYVSTLDRRTASTAALLGGVSTGLVLSQSLGTGSGEFYQGSITLLNFTDTSTFKHITAEGNVYDSTPTFRSANLDALVATGNALTDIRFAASSGNLSGKITVKGEVI